MCDLYCWYIVSGSICFVYDVFCLHAVCMLYVCLCAVCKIPVCLCAVLELYVCLYAVFMLSVCLCAVCMLTVCFRLFILAIIRATNCPVGLPFSAHIFPCYTFY